MQDCCVIHTSEKHMVRIGKGVSIGHGAIVHGATIEDDCIIGINSTVLDEVHVGRGSIIAANAVVPPGKEIPPYSLVAGMFIVGCKCDCFSCYGEVTMSAGALAIALFGSLVFYGGLAYCIYQAMRGKGWQ